MNLRRKDAALRRKTPKVFRGVDLEQEAWRYCQHLGFKRNVEIQVVHSAVLGRTHGEQWLMVTQLTIGFGEALPDVLQMLLHEICHVTGDLRDPATVNYMNHTQAFIERLVFAARDLWGINIDGWTEVTQGRRECLAYAIDDFLTAKLVAHLAAGGYIPVGLEGSK